MNYIQEPSHEPCPLCGWVCSKCKSQRRTQDEIIFDQYDEVIRQKNNFILGVLFFNNLTPYQQSVFVLHEIRKKTFPEIAIALNKKETAVRKCWQRCKLRIPKTLQEYNSNKCRIPPYI